MRICNLCGDTSSLRVLLDAYKHDATPPEFVTYLFCEKCSFVSLDADYEKKMTSYEHDSSGRSDEMKAHSYFQSTLETCHVIQAACTSEITEITQSILNGKGKVFLDVGSGWGAVLNAFRQFGWEVHGIEPGRPQSEYARTVHGLDAKTAYYEKDSFPQNFCDFIYSRHVLEHIARPWKFFMNFNYHLKLGGLGYFEVPNVSMTMRPHLGWGHVSMFGSQTLIGILTAAGFEILAIHDDSPNGFGCFVKKVKNLESNFDLEFIPENAINWKPLSYWKTRLSLHHAFYLFDQRRSLLKNLARIIYKEIYYNTKKIILKRKVIGVV